jgi:hypothetical protein
VGAQQLPVADAASMASMTWAMTSVDSSPTMWAPRISWVSWSTTSFSVPWDRKDRRPRARRKIGRGGRHAPAGGARREPVRFPRARCRRPRSPPPPGWSARVGRHVAGGVDAGRGGALLLVDGDAAVVPKPHAGVVQAELFHVGQAGVAQTTASTSTGRTEHYANRDESRAVEAPPLAI